MSEGKRCTKCKRWFELSAFRKNARYAGGHVTWCKECSAEYGKGHFQKNKSKILSRHKKWKENNPGKMCEYVRKWVTSHPEYAERRRELTRRRYTGETQLRIQQSNREFYKKNKRTFFAKNANRKARMLRARPKWANQKQIRLFYEKCPDGHHVDHIIPLKGKDVSGLHVIENLQYLPRLANLKKSNKLVIEELEVRDKKP